MNDDRWSNLRKFAHFTSATLDGYEKTRTQARDALAILDAVTAPGTAKFDIRRFPIEGEDGVWMPTDVAAYCRFAIHDKNYAQHGPDHDPGWTLFHELTGLTPAGDADKMLADRYEAATAPPQDAEPEPDDLVMDAWAVIANARNWLDDPKCESEWVQAAIRWRERFHATLPSSPETEATAPPPPKALTRDEIIREAKALIAQSNEPMAVSHHLVEVEAEHLELLRGFLQKLALTPEAATAPPPPKWETALREFYEPYGTRPSLDQAISIVRAALAEEAVQ